MRGTQFEKMRESFSYVLNDDSLLKPRRNSAQTEDSLDPMDISDSGSKTGHQLLERDVCVAVERS